MSHLDIKEMNTQDMRQHDSEDSQSLTDSLDSISSLIDFNLSDIEESDETRLEELVNDLQCLFVTQEQRALLINAIDDKLNQLESLLVTASASSENAKVAGSQASAAAPALSSPAAETSVQVSTQNQTSAEAVEMTKERAKKVLNKARKAFVNQEPETLKSILPLVDNYPDKLLSLLAEELKRTALRTNPWLYIGLATVLQKAFINSEIRNKIGQASLLSLLKRIVNLFNESVIITTGDQTIPYLALDVLNLCFMNLNELGINRLPKPVIEEIVAKLTAIKPASLDISDVIKMQREFAENMLKSINADIGTFDKAKPHLVAGAKVGLGLGFVMGGIGTIALTGNAAQGVKLISSGATMTFSGGWAFYQFIIDQQSSWYPETLKAYQDLATIKEASSQQEEKLKAELEKIRKGGDLRKYDVGLLGIIYSLIQLYPDIKQKPVKHEIIETLAAMAYKPDQSIVAAASGLFKSNKLYPKPFLRKNALLALKYIADNHDSKKADDEYIRCLSSFKSEKNLTQAMDKQYPFFCALSTFMNDITKQFANAKPTLLEEVLKEEIIQTHHLKQAHSSQNADASTSSHSTELSLELKGKVGTVDAGHANSTNIPVEKTEIVLNHQLELAKLGSKSQITVHPEAKIKKLYAGSHNMHFAPPSSKDKKKERKKEKSKKGKSASSTSTADSNEKSKLSGPRTS